MAVTSGSWEELDELEDDDEVVDDEVLDPLDCVLVVGLLSLPPSPPSPTGGGGGTIPAGGTPTMPVFS